MNGSGADWVPVACRRPAGHGIRFVDWPDPVPQTVSFFADLTDLVVAPLDEPNVFVAQSMLS